MVTGCAPLLCRVRLAVTGVPPTVVPPKLMVVGLATS